MQTARALLAVALSLSSATAVAGAQEIPDEGLVLAELSLARTQPATYAGFLEALLPYFDGRILRIPGETAMQTNEGARAVREAIAFLRRARPLPALHHSPGLALAARDHVDDQGPRGALGHVGRDGSDLGDRVRRYGAWTGSLSENIDYGSHTARRVVISLIVDDGVSGRGHRENIFDPQARFAGVACGPHREYRVMCVIDFAENALRSR